MEFDAKPVFHINIFSGDVHFNVLIIWLCWIFLIIGKTLGKGTLQKVFVGGSMETWGDSLA